MNWTFTPDEFAFVWRETGLDRFPSPLAIVTTARTEDAAAHQEEAARRRYPHRENPELSVALRVAAHPSTHIKIVADSMRMAGCALNGTAAVIVQADSMIRVSLIREAVLTETLAEAVPEATAGSKPAMSASAARGICNCSRL